MKIKIFIIKGKNIKDFDFSYELKEWEEIYRLKNNIVNISGLWFFLFKILQNSRKITIDN